MMINENEKSKETLIREKKEAELREARRKENEAKRRKDKQGKCMIGGTFLKYFPESLLFEADEWDRIVRAVIKSKEFISTVQAIKKEASAGKKSALIEVKPEVSEEEEEYFDEEDTVE